MIIDTHLHYWERPTAERPHDPEGIHWGEEMLAEARAEADAELAGGNGPAVIVTASANWHPGIVGLIASRLKDYARRPAFAIAFNPNGIGRTDGGHD